MTINLPMVFSQRDPRWKDRSLGFGAINIEAGGCIICALATLCRYFGKKTDPDQLNEDLKKVGGFQGALYRWGHLNKVYSDIKLEKQVKTPDPLTEGHFKEIDKDLEGGYPILLEVDSVPATAKVDQHFVLLIGKEGNSYKVVDPWTGKIEPLSKFGVAKITIQRYILYRGPKPNPDSIDNMTREELIADLKRHKKWLADTESDLKDWKIWFKSIEGELEETKKLLEDQETQNSLLRGKIADAVELRDDQSELLGECRVKLTATQRLVAEGTHGLELKEQTISKIDDDRNNLREGLGNAQEELRAKSKEIERLSKLETENISLKEELTARDRAIKKLEKDIYDRIKEVENLKRKLVETGKGVSSTVKFDKEKILTSLVKATKEFFRIVIIPAAAETLHQVSGLIADQSFRDIHWEIILPILGVAFIKGLDKFVHEFGKETENPALIKGLVRF